jgi:hypothetical protein
MTPDQTSGLDRSGHDPSRVHPALLPGALVAFVALSAAACASAPVDDPGRSDGYRTAFPHTDMSESLARGFQSVKPIGVTTTYDVHLFAEEDAPTAVDLERGDVIPRAFSTLLTSETRGATAVVVSRSRRAVMLLTAGHAVHRPDTIVEYFGPVRPGAPAGAEPGRRIRSLSIKSGQTNWVTGLPGVRTFEVLAGDQDEDIAVIGFEHREEDDLDEAFPMPVQTGDPTRLVPGSFVYILGYPSGFRMVSRGIATPMEDGGGSFVIDGNWNEGVSGGAVLALRGNSGTLEWVGMARAAAARREQQFVPPEAAIEQHDPAVPYDGPIFLQEILRIQYGITLSVPMTAIRRFMEDNRARLRERGYAMPAGL